MPTRHNYTHLGLHFVPTPCHSAPNFEADFLCNVPGRHFAQQTYPNEALCPLCCLLCLRYFFLSPIHFSLSAQKKFVTNFVTHITNFVTHITNFVIRVTNFLTHVTKFVTKTILYERKKYQAEKKNYLLERKNYHGDTRCLFLILLDTFCSYYLKR